VSKKHRERRPGGRSGLPATAQDRALREVIKKAVPIISSIDILVKQRRFTRPHSRDRRTSSDTHATCRKDLSETNIYVDFLLTKAALPHMNPQRNHNTGSVNSTCRNPMLLRLRDDKGRESRTSPRPVGGRRCSRKKGILRLMPVAPGPSGRLNFHRRLPDDT